MANQYYFHLGADYGMSELNCFKLVKKTEDILVISENFRLPERKKPAKSNTGIESAPADATGVRYNRMKKDRNFIIQVKKGIP